jgi:hypothetical protein
MKLNIVSLYIYRADKCVLASSGFQGDIKALHKNLAARELVKFLSHNFINVKLMFILLLFLLSSC